MLSLKFTENWHVGDLIEGGVNSFIERYGETLGLFSDNVEENLQALLQNILDVPSWGIILATTLLITLFKRKISLALLNIISLLLIEQLGLWREMLETALLVLLSTGLSVFLGVPLGILAAKKKWLYKILHPFLDLMQTLPTFVYLIPTLMIFGLGVVPGIVSTVIFALPAPLRLTYLGFHNVPFSLLEVSRAFGLGPWQQLFKIEFPSARPMIMAGISQCIMLSLSMVVIAALVGANGLGKPVVQALNTVNIVKGLEAGLAIVLVAIIFDRTFKINPQEIEGSP